MEVGQRQFNGLLMGAGTNYRIREETGLTTLAVRSGTRPAPRAAGSIPGLHVADSKLITLTVDIKGTPAQVEERDAILRAACTVSESDQFQYRFRTQFGDDSFVWARVLDRPGKHDLESELVGFLRRTVGFEVADPRIYSVEEHSMEVPILSSGFPGFNFPINFPLNMAAGSQSTAFLSNAGDQNAYPRCRFQYLTGGTGDFDGIVLTNLTTGVVLTIDRAVSAGQILEADMDAYVRALPDDPIVSIGATSFFGDWQHPRDPFYLAPGVNEISFEVQGNSPTSDAVCSVTWRDTSL